MEHTRNNREGATTWYGFLKLSIIVFSDKVISGGIPGRGFFFFFDFGSIWLFTLSEIEAVASLSAAKKKKKVRLTIHKFTVQQTYGQMIGENRRAREMPFLKVAKLNTSSLVSQAPL